MRGAGFLKGSAALAFVAVALSACASLPAHVVRTPSAALADMAGTTLGQAIAPLAAAHPGLSGIYPLVDGRDAFAARALLAAAAQRSMDRPVLYMAQGSSPACCCSTPCARRQNAGVRVRLLLDDNNTAGLDPVPWRYWASSRTSRSACLIPSPSAAPRSARLLCHAIFPRLNRRMHNKSFTADNQATIVGGRNVGDEYFGAAGDVLFVDLDVLTVGPVVVRGVARLRPLLEQRFGLSGLRAGRRRSHPGAGTGSARGGGAAQGAGGACLSRCAAQAAFHRTADAAQPGAGMGQGAPGQRTIRRKY
jgi:hypothetical protein